MGDLEKINGKPQIGFAQQGGAELPVDFCLQGRETYVNIHDPSVTTGGLDDIELLPVRMTDGTHVTFIGNIVTGATNYHGTGGSILTYMPHFVLVGRDGVDEGYKVNSVSFSVDDVESIFYDFDAFSIALDGKEELKSIVAKQEAAIGRKIELGDHPIISYFTGKFDILSTETAHGKLTVHHSPSHGMGGPGGIAIRNKIKLQLDLPEPTQVAGVIERLMPHLRFLQLIAGRKQKIDALRVKLEGADEHSWLDLLWCLAWTRREEGKGPHPADLPINGGINPHEFSSVLTSWLGADEKRLDARVRFAESFSQQRSYGIDRLVSAANMFDILPSDCFTKPSGLSPELKAARETARTAFKALAPSDIRDRALSDLGRLDQLNLKAKVQQRAKKIIDAAPDGYPHLDQLLRNAVDSRNHYVHGTDVGPAKAEFFRNMLSFHVAALEYVFATADLLDAGWDFGAWLKRGTTMSHPFGEFSASYKSRIGEYLSEYKSLIS